MIGLLKKMRPVLETIREDLRDGIKCRSNPDELIHLEYTYWKELTSKGFVVIPEYLERMKALKLKSDLERLLGDGTRRDFECGAYIRSNEGNLYDGGVRRIYRVDRLLPELNVLKDDPMPFRVAKAYYGFQMHSGTYVFQHNVVSNIHTRSFHIDWFDKQFKTFLYLDDVGIENGPFSYIPGSHKIFFHRWKKQVFGSFGTLDTSFSERELGSWVNLEVPITGAAGTLIMADVRGIHRGWNQKSAPRSILVNYMYRQGGEKEIGR